MTTRTEGSSVTAETIVGATKNIISMSRAVPATLPNIVSNNRHGVDGVARGAFAQSGNDVRRCGWLLPH